MTSNIDWSQAKKRFNQTAATYADAAVVPKEIAKRLIERLSFVKHQPKTILDLGTGSGEWLPALKKLYPEAGIVALDLAIERLKKAPTHHSHNVAANVYQLPIASNSVDAVLSNLCFHWCLDTAVLFNEINRVLKPGGLLMFSSLGPDTLQQLRYAFSDIDQASHVLPFYDMHDLGDALLQEGFENPVTDAERITLTYTHPLQLLRDLQEMGENNCLEDRPRTLMGKHRWKHLLAVLETKRLPNGLLPITYEIIYGHAWASTKNDFNSNGEYRIPFENIPIRRAPK